MNEIRILDYLLMVVTGVVGFVIREIWQRQGRLEDKIESINTSLGAQLHSTELKIVGEISSLKDMIREDFVTKELCNAYHDGRKPE